MLLCVVWYVSRSQIVSGDPELISWVMSAVYLPGKLRADNCLARPSTTATYMDLVILMSVHGTN